MRGVLMAKSLSHPQLSSWDKKAISDLDMEGFWHSDKSGRIAFVTLLLEYEIERQKSDS